MKALRKELLKGLLLPLSAFILVLIYNYLKTTHLIDDFYTTGISRWMLSGIASLTSRIPISIGEILAGAVILLLILNLAALFLAIMKRKNVLVSFFRITNLLSVLLIGFLILWGFNYRQMGIAYTSSKYIPAEIAHVNDLVPVMTDLIQEARNERSASGLSEESPFVFLGDMNVSALEAYAALGQDYGGFLKPEGRAKPLAASRFFSQLGISGIFIPFTAEANYNDHQPDLLKPAAILHELAHLKGVSREGEANFIAYLASRYSEDPQLRYSATMLALIHAENSLRIMDAAQADELFLLYSPGMVRDLIDHNEYWMQFMGRVQEQSRQVNDTYLKANGQEDGVATYEEMVGYLVNYFKIHNNVNLNQ